MAEESSILGNILGGIGSVLSAPRNFIYGNMISPLMGQDVNSFGDILGATGLGDGTAKDVLGFLGDVATDPLTYLGAFGSSALRNKLLANRVSLGKGPGISTGLKTQPAIRETIEEMPVLYNPKTAYVDDAGIGTGLSDDFETYRKTVSGSNPIEETMEIMGGDDITRWRAELKAGSNRIPEDRLIRAIDRMENLPDSYTVSRNRPSWYSPETNAAYIRENPLDLVDEVGDMTSDGLGMLGTVRHERMHGLVENAIKDPALRAELGFLPRMAARMRGSDNSFIQGLGSIADEAAAQAANARSFGGQAKNVARYLFEPNTNRYYTDWMGRAGTSPLARRLYQSLPSTIPVAGGLAGHGLSTMGE